MINGEINPNWLEVQAADGEYVRKDSVFRDWISTDAGARYPAAAGRYHLYLAHACPWCQRVYIYLKLMRLESVISCSFVHPDMLDLGWKFEAYPDSDLDSLNHCDYMYQIYALADPHYTGIVTVPVLWDKQSRCIVSNESSEIIRMLNTAFLDFTDVKVDYYPQQLQADIDEINEWIYHTVNNGVYRCGFASDQAAYEKAYDELFASLERLENILAGKRYLLGRQITEADWRLLPTLLRFDPVYYSHFKCNKKRLLDYPNLYNYMCELFQVPGIADTFKLQQVKRHYYFSHTSINPTQIVPKGPEIDYFIKHDRHRLEAGDHL